MAQPALLVSLVSLLVALPAGAKSSRHSHPAKARSAAAASSFQAFPFPVEEHSLKNGLRVAFVTFDSPGLVAYYTLMRVGSRNEPEKGRSGYAHFFEHMMFRGTKAHSGTEYNATVTRLGLNTNAFTSNDMTVYHLYGPTQSLPTIIDYESDRFQHLDYPEDEFKTEAGAILGEYAKSASNPELLLEEKMFGTAYGKHTYQHTTLGFLDDVKAMPQGFAYSRQFFSRFYTPDDATIVIAGDFDHARTLALIESAYGGWKGKAKAAAIPKEPPQSHARRGHIDWPAQTQPRVWVAWHTPGAGELRASAAQLMLNAYLFGPTSKLHQELVLGAQLCESIEATWDNHRDPYLFGVLAEVKKEADLDTVEKAIVASVRELAAGKIERARLEAVRSNLKFSAALELETADGVAHALAVSSAQTGDLQSLNKLYAQIDRLTASDLSAFARRWLTEQNRTTITLTSAKKEVAK